MEKKKVLGKGLSALLSDEYGEEEKPALPGKEAVTFLCEIEKIRPSPLQPRKEIPPSRLEGLVRSIREKGLLQPLIVRPAELGYELIAGERRLLAALRAGLTEVPVVLKRATDHEALEMILIENLQREDLNPIEAAEGYRRLTQEYGLTQEEVSRRIGKDRATVANYLRLLKLPPKIQRALLEEKISMGHARALLAVKDEDRLKALADRVIKKGLSVRQTEELTQREGEEKPSPQPPPNPQLQYLADELKGILGTRVVIRERGKKGKIEIEYYSPEDLDRIIEIIRK